MKKRLTVLIFIALIIPLSAFAGSLSNYAENALLNHLFGTAYTPAATVYIALATANPGEAGTGAALNEVANSGNYTRKSIAFSAAASRKVVQSGAITFNQASGSWGTVTHWALLDSGTYGAGNMLAYGAFTVSFAPVSGNTPSIADLEVEVEISASSGEGFTSYLVHKLLDLMFRNTAYAQPTSCIALLDQTGADTDTTLTTAGKEVTWTGYARVTVNKVGGASPTWDTIASGATQNANAVSFGTVGASPTIIVGMAIVDSCTLNAGNVLAYDNDQVVDQTPNEGDTVQFAIGAIDVSLD